MQIATLITAVMFLFAFCCAEDVQDLVGVSVPGAAATLATADVLG